MSTPAPAGRVWAFDLGKASLGEAVREANTFLHVASWLIPPEFACRGPASVAGTPASRYRAWKTRQAHRAREDRLRAVCEQAGIEVLNAKRVARDTTTGRFRVVQEADPRLQREFPKKGDETCYTSCLLRIKLLAGEKLEGWQIYKALRSAIQRRGFDSAVPWKTRTRPDDDDDEGATQQAADAYRNVLTQMAPAQPAFHLPCYLEAWRLGLWSAEKPSALKLRIDHRTEAARNRNGIVQLIAPRELVVAEVRRLIEAASISHPALAGRADEILFGRGGRAYASFFPELRRRHDLRRGGTCDWEGILGQKVPRFDNRIISKCALITRLNACKAEPRQLPDKSFAPDSILPAEVTFLLKLKNIRVQRATGVVDGLTAKELGQLFEMRHPKGPANYSFTEQQWKTALAKLNLLPVPGHAEVSSPRNSGRSRFSRPALRILRELLLSGRSPLEQHAIELARVGGNADPRKGLLAADVGFLRRMGDSWSELYVPDQQYDRLIALRGEVGAEEAIKDLIGSCNNPVVRHRLDAFWARLRALEQQFGRPTEVVLEFVREDFMGKEARKKLFKFQNERAKARLAARERAKELGAAARSAALKWELLEAQRGVCLYTGESLPQTAIEDLVIDHIVPRGEPYRGPDAMVNFVVTRAATNNEKANRIPYEWFQARQFEGWDAYVGRVNERATSLRGKKVRLLTLPDAGDLVQRYTALAETAYIARLAQTLVALQFGWPIRHEEGTRAITIVNGGLTARIRRRYHLNSLLSPCPAGEDPRDWEEACEKNRGDKRHHGLDAMVISYIPGWARDAGKERFFQLPAGVDRNTFSSPLERILPQPLVLAKPELEATVYGRRILSGRNYGVKRVPLADFAVKMVKNKRVLKPAKDLKPQQIVDGAIRREVERFFTEHLGATLEDWDTWVASYRRGGSDGPRVRKVLVTVTEADALEEYKDLSKDGSGQFRRGQPHRGYYVVEVPSPVSKNPGRRKLQVEPVYAHQAPQQRERALRGLIGAVIKGYFESGCTIQLDRGVDHPKTPLAPGLYRLNTIRADTFTVVTDYKSEISAPIGLAKLIAAGFRRVS